MKIILHRSIIYNNNSNSLPHNYKNVVNALVHIALEFKVNCYLQRGKHLGMLFYANRHFINYRNMSCIYI